MNEHSHCRQGCSAALETKSGSLQQRIRPSTHAAVIRTWKHAWVTDRIMRGCSPTLELKCIFGCGGNAVDSIEHYVYCRCIRNAVSAILTQQAPSSALPTGPKEVILMEGCASIDDVIIRAIWIGLLYSSYNGLKHQTGNPTDSLCKGDLVNLLRSRLLQHKGHSTQHDCLQW